MLTSQQDFVEKTNIPELFRRTREKLRKSQENMAVLLSIDRSYLSQIESGKKTPSEKIVKKLTELVVEKTTDGENVLKDDTVHYGVKVGNLFVDSVGLLLDRWAGSDPDSLRQFAKLQEDILARKDLSEMDIITVRELARRIRAATEKKTG